MTEEKELTQCEGISEYHEPSIEKDQVLDVDPLSEVFHLHYAFGLLLDKRLGGRRAIFDRVSVFLGEMGYGGGVLVGLIGERGGALRECRCGRTCIGLSHD